MLRDPRTRGAPRFLSGIDCMPNHYDRQGAKPVEFDFEAGGRAGRDGALSLTGMDVLGIIQSAFDDLGAQNAQIIAVKREVLDLVADGQYAHAVRAAIVGAGKACRQD